MITLGASGLDDAEAGGDEKRDGTDLGASGNLFAVAYAEPVTVMNENQLEEAIAAMVPGGVIQLGDNITLSDNIRINNGIAFTISGNGKTLYRAGASTITRHFQLSGAGTNLIITDITFDGEGSGGGIEVSGNAQLVMEAKSVIQNVEYTGARGGAGIYIDSDSSFTMNAGEITNNIAPNQNYPGQSGGGVCNYGKMIVNKGSFTGNVGRNGGAIANYGDITINGGIMSGNDSYYGGALYLMDSVNALIQNCAITDNQAENGGGINIEGNTIAEIRNVTIGNNSTNNHGGAMYICDGAVVKLYSGHIYGNTSQISIGGVYIARDSSLIMEDGTIEYNSPTGVCNNRGYFMLKGGVIQKNSARGVTNQGGFVMEGGQISENTTTASGDGVYNDGIFDFKGGEIKGNTAASSGGGVITYTPFTMENGIISGNTAATGGGVYAFGTAATFYMKGGEISGNSASGNGGVSSETFFMYGGAINNNSAINGGGVHSLEISFITSGIIAGNMAAENGGGYMSQMHAIYRKHKSMEILQRAKAAESTNTILGVPAYYRFLLHYGKYYYIIAVKQLLWGRAKAEKEGPPMNSVVDRLYARFRICRPRLSTTDTLGVPLHTEAAVCIRFTTVPDPRPTTAMTFWGM